MPASNVLAHDFALATSLKKNGESVATVEHLLSTLHARGVDNLLIELDSSEIPILDGSGKQFLDIYDEIGLAKQSELRHYYRITKEVVVKQGDRIVIARPTNMNHLKLKYDIYFDHPLIGYQELELELDSTSYSKEIGSARTFCFERDVQFLIENGLARGGSLDNAVVLTDEGSILNPSLRYADEFVRHKMLDLIGDLYLLNGFHLIGDIHASRAGHALHVALLNELI